MKPMRTVSFKLPVELDEALGVVARQRRSTRSVLFREAAEIVVRGKLRSVTALAGALVGSVDGPRDLATNKKHLAGFGK